MPTLAQATGVNTLAMSLKNGLLVNEQGVAMVTQVLFFIAPRNDRRVTLPM